MTKKAAPSDNPHWGTTLDDYLDERPKEKPVADEELRQIRQQLRVPAAVANTTVPVTAAPRPVIVKARKPRPRR
jgi:hypothetical protein